MLNREGGDIVLGVDDHGNVTGIEGRAVEALKNDLVALSNNRNKLDPPFILFPQSYETAQVWIIHIQIPASSLVHKTANHVYDRSSDGDFRVSQPHQIAEIYNRKRTQYTEGIIYRNINLDGF